MAMTPSIIRLVYLFIALDVFLLDRWTKWLVLQNLPLYGTITVIPGFFKLVHLQNPGAAFSMLASAPLALRLGILIGLSSIALVFVMVLLWRSSSRFTWTGLGLALVMGGAFGNLWDRVLKQQVTDFLLVYYKTHEWPAFNVADSAITVGASILILQILFGHEAQTASPATTGESR